jgi:hypothetical protein
MGRTTRLQPALQRVADWDRHHVPLTPKPILAAEHGVGTEDRMARSITDFAGSMRCGISTPPGSRCGSR